MKLAITALILMAFAAAACIIQNWWDGMTAEDRMRRALVVICIVVVVSLVVALLVASRAFAQEHRGHTHAGEVGKFYQSWMRPDNRSISCCHDKDCAPAQSKLVSGSWYARNSDAEEWVQVPSSRIEHDRDSPDGQSHLCKTGVTGSVYVYCFLPANGS